MTDCIGPPVARGAQGHSRNNPNPFQKYPSLPDLQENRRTKQNCPDLPTAQAIRDNSKSLDMKAQHCTGMQAQTNDGHACPISTRPLCDLKLKCPNRILKNQLPQQQQNQQRQHQRNTNATTTIIISTTAVKVIVCNQSTNQSINQSIH